MKKKSPKTGKKAAKPKPGSKRRRASFDDVLDGVREIIISRRTSRNELISEQTLVDELAEKGLGVSRQPVRRALAQLEVERIVQILPQKGTLICWPDPSELRQNWDSRAAVEEFLLCRLARKKAVDLSRVLAEQQAMERMAKASQLSPLLPETHDVFLRHDEAFHEQLAVAADYPELVFQLRSLRTRLQMSAQIARDVAAARMVEVVREHQSILKALHYEPIQGTKMHRLRPDINAVKLAIRIHLRNSASDWWTIERFNKKGAIRYGANRHPVLDLPRSLKSASQELDMSPAYLLWLRLVIETLAVRRVAGQDEADLQSLVEINAAMTQLIADHDLTSTEVQHAFIDLDIDFHATVCFLSGMLFAEDATLFVWRRLYELCDNRIEASRMKAIVKEHTDIIKSLRSSSRKDVRVKDAELQMTKHLHAALVTFRTTPTRDKETMNIVEQLGAIAEQMTVFQPPNNASD